MLDVKEPGSNGAKVIVLRLHPEGAAIAQTLYRSDRNFDLRRITDDGQPTGRSRDA